MALRCHSRVYAITIFANGNCNIRDKFALTIRPNALHCRHKPMQGRNAAVARIEHETPACHNFAKNSGLHSLPMFTGEFRNRRSQMVVNGEKVWCRTVARFDHGPQAHGRGQIQRAVAAQRQRMELRRSTATGASLTHDSQQPPNRCAPTNNFPPGPSRTATSAGGSFAWRRIQPFTHPRVWRSYRLRSVPHHPSPAFPYRIILSTPRPDACKA